VPCLNHAFLGYAANPMEASKIIHETGIFYLSISVAYLFSFLYMHRHSKSIRKMKKPHIFGILMWGFAGGILILGPSHFGTFFNFFVLSLAIVVLYRLHFIIPLVAESSIMAPKLPSDDKKKMYADKLLKKGNYTLSDVVSSTFINEQILWLFILYRAAVTLRASIGI
jgi:hypothetical protein